jgi:hypothetical protein
MARVPSLANGLALKPKDLMSRYGIARHVARQWPIALAWGQELAAQRAAERDAEVSAMLAQNAA